MTCEMTEITKRLYDAARSDILTIQDAVQYLEWEAKFRSLREKLEKFSHGQDLRTTLVEGLLKNDPQRKRDAVERRVRGWLNGGKIRSIKKQDAIEVCFILKLSVEEADQFVAMVSEEALHYRNPDEIVYIFALQHKKTYDEALEIKKRMKKTLENISDVGESTGDSFTPIIRTEISALKTEEELKDYLSGAAGRLGRYHNYAFSEFKNRMEILETPQTESQAGKEDPEKQHLTIRDILREYLFGNNILYAKQKKREGKKKDSGLSDEEKLVFTKVQESVSESWPDETTLSKMKTRKKDVTRKVLILLFLATDQGKDWGDEEWEGMKEDEEEDDSYYFEDLDEEATKDEVFEDLYNRLNDMLALCGFATLDPRSPFDWLILYCICVEDMFDVDIRMRGIFKEMFGECEESDGGK